MTAPRRWVVTGVSSGLGLAIADAALRRGDEVCGTVRTEADSEAFTARHPAARAYEVDVRDRAATFRTIDEIARGGTMDVVVNNAGFGLLGAVEELAEEELRSVFDTNFFGAVNVLQAVLPHLRAQGSGHILVMSSMSGIASAAGAGAYSATKFALEGLSEALALEVAPLGVTVTILQPSAFRTNGSRATQLASTTLPAYLESSGLTRIAVKDDSRPRGNPAVVAEAVLRLVDLDDPPLRLPVGRAAADLARATSRARLAELDRCDGLVEPAVPG